MTLGKSALFYVAALLLAALFYALPEWFGHAWLFDRVLTAVCAAFVLVFALERILRG